MRIVIPTYLKRDRGRQTSPKRGEAPGATSTRCQCRYTPTVDNRCSDGAFEADHRGRLEQSTPCRPCPADCANRCHVVRKCPICAAFCAADGALDPTADPRRPGSAGNHLCARCLRLRVYSGRAARTRRRARARAGTRRGGRERRTRRGIEPQKIAIGRCRGKVRARAAASKRRAPRPQKPLACRIFCWSHTIAGTPRADSAVTVDSFFCGRR